MGSLRKVTYGGRWLTAVSLGGLACATVAHAQASPSLPENAAPDGASPANPAEIIVLGVRGAQRAALSIKRNAPQIVDSIVAEDFGKLPDSTIADSLQRVPGIQIDRSAGEGSSVNIR